MSKLIIRKENEPNAQLKSMNSTPNQSQWGWALIWPPASLGYLVHWCTRYSLIHIDTADVARKFWSLTIVDSFPLPLPNQRWDHPINPWVHNLVSSSFEYFDKRDYEKKIGVLVCVGIRNHIWTWCYICGPNISKSIQQIPNVCLLVFMPSNAQQK